MLLNDFIVEHLFRSYGEIGNGGSQSKTTLDTMTPPDGLPVETFIVVSYREIYSICGKHTCTAQQTA
jgi:hypothetical protein